MAENLRWMKTSLTLVIVTIILYVFIYQQVLPKYVAGSAAVQVGRNVDRDWNGGLLKASVAEIEMIRAKIYRTALHIHIAVVICGNRLEEGMVMMKSAIIFSRVDLVFHIFTEDKHRPTITAKLNSWVENQKGRLKFNIYKTQFPSCPKCNPGKWERLFRPCASQRLFLLDILLDVDSLIYLDTDNLFLSPVEDVWEHFNKFTPQQIAGIVPNLSGYYKDKTFPYCTDTGVNSGVMLMNLTRMRATQWLVKMHEHFTTYERHLKLGDQDLINIYCHFNPGQFYTMACSWNYRFQFCPAKHPCNETAYILHGNTQLFHRNKHPAIRGVYQAFKRYNLTGDTLNDLYNNLTSTIKLHSATDCGKRPELFTQHLKEYIRANYRFKGG